MANRFQTRLLRKAIPATQAEVCRAYIGAVVLGMNDALVEMTGTLAGLTMALGNNKLIALAGLITGVAATLSMTASEFLAEEAETDARRPCVAAMYTGVTYLLMVSILLAPYLLLSSPLGALALCLGLAALIIFVFTFFVARLRKTRFLPYFLRMLTISFSVSALAFGISWFARKLWGIDA